VDDLESEIRQLFRSVADRVGPVAVPPEPDPTARPASARRWPSTDTFRLAATAFAAVAVLAAGLTWAVTSRTPTDRSIATAVSSGVDTTSAVPTPSDAPGPSTSLLAPPTTLAAGPVVPAASGCASTPVAPVFLLDRSAPGGGTPGDSLDGPTVRWGRADDARAVTQILGTEPDASVIEAGASSGYHAEHGPFSGVVTIEAGNAPSAPVDIVLQDARIACVRRYRIGPGVTMGDAIDYLEDWLVTAAELLPLTSPTDGSTLLALRSDAPVLTVSRTVVGLDGYDPRLVVLTPDGSFVVARDDGELLSLHLLSVDGDAVPLGITVHSDDSSVFFGPGGDLFTGWVEGSVVTLSRHRMDEARRGELVDTVTGEFQGGCGFAITSSSVGCVNGTGPSLVIDPPQPVDQITVDTALDWVERHGGGVDRRWTVGFEPGVGCADSCETGTFGGPNGGVVWVMPFDTGRATRSAVFVLDDRPIAGSAYLPADVRIIGVRGRVLLAVQTVDGNASVVSIDLTAVLAPPA
jgi:hypothetical protein